MNSTQHRGRLAGRSLGVLAVALGLVASATAQKSDTGTVPASTSGKPAGAPVNAVGKLDKSELPTLGDRTLARITAQNVQLRCFASSQSPVYEGALAAGTIVEVGDETGEFRQVRLPLGVIGYVSKKFSTDPVDGVVRTKGARVSFRYRPTPPRRAEQPVERLATGTDLKVLGERGDWYQVRRVTESAYIALKDIEVLDNPDADAIAKWQALAASHRGAWQKGVADRAAKIAAVAREQELAGQLKTIRAAYVKELEKELGAQKMAPHLVAVGEFLAAAEGEAELHAAGKRLEKSMQTQQILVRAQTLVSNPPKKGKAPKLDKVKTPKDPLAHLQHIGWLSYHPRATGAAAFRLTKGGQVVRYLKCSSMKYDLTMYHGVEIGVIGKQKQDDLLSYLDVEKIVVLGHAR